MEFRLLGPVEAVRDGRSLPLGGSKPRALLALLALSANDVVSRDRLLEALWPERPPGSADHSLDVHVSRLRKALEPDKPLVTRGGGYVLEVDPERIDVRRFERLLAAGREANAVGKPEDALVAVEAALGLWRGDALGDLAYEGFARDDVPRLEELRLVATEERIDAELALGHQDRLVPELEALISKHPLRERPRGQLMLALYRAGRQAEALRVYSDARMRLVDELGIEPSQALRELEQAILRQDPGLDLPRAVPETRRRRTLVGAGALTLAAAAVAVMVGVTQGGTESAQALAEPDSNAFLNASSGELVRSAPVRDTVRVAYGDGALWSLSATGELTRLDPTTGKEMARIGLGIKPSGLEVGEGSVWVTGRTSPTLLRIDPTVNEVDGRFPLPMKGVETDLTGEVAVGAGSVWVGHGAFDPGARVERLDPETGRVQAQFSILGGDVDHLAFAEGSLWVASTPSGQLRKINPQTNEVAFVRRLQPQLCCVAAGGGYAWAASNPAGVIWKVSTDGSVLPTITLGSAIQSLRYADGALWAALGEEGAVVRIDPTTDKPRAFDVGHSVTSVDARDGLIAAGVRHRTEDVTGDLSGDVVWIARKGPELFDSGAPTDPAFTFPTWDAPQEMFHYTTCARLLNHPDVEGSAGRSIVPEVAEDLPEFSDGGRTVTFTIRRGFGFSPPSDEQVTAESFRRAIERGVELAKLDGVPLPASLANIVGADKYYAGQSSHISGISAEDREFVIRLRVPAPDLPWLTAASSCAVPVDTPVVEGGLEKPVASAGPYYLATLTESLAVLKRNPHYGGSRPQHLDAIVVEFNVAPSEAATRIENGTLDYFLESQNPTLRPNTAAARAAGDRYGRTPYNRIQFFAFNTDRPLFRAIRMRRAVQYALDRKALADSDPAGGLPATRLLYPSIVGYDDTPLYPLRGDVSTARKLAAGRTANVVVSTWDDPPYTDALNRSLRNQLAAIGLDMTILSLTNRDFANGGAGYVAKATRSDIFWGGLNEHTADPAAYLQPLYLPTQQRRNELARLLRRKSPKRERAALAIAHRVERDSLYAVYINDALPELVSRRLGCIVHQPEYAGVDLAALCLRQR